MQLSDLQILHRQYLKSPVWKAKRKQALAHYGCICFRCQEYGNDVHHKTYERVGGAERMEDLEVLCRDCHTAHHRAEKHKRGRSRNAIGRRIIYRYLSNEQRKKLANRFGLRQAELEYKIRTDNFFTYIAAAMLGFQNVCEGYGLPNRLPLKRGVFLRGYRPTFSSRHQTGIWQRSSVKSNNRSGC